MFILIVLNLCTKLIYELPTYYIIVSNKIAKNCKSRNVKRLVQKIQNLYTIGFTIFYFCINLTNILFSYALCAIYKSLYKIEVWLTTKTFFKNHKSIYNNKFCIYSNKKKKLCIKSNLPKPVTEYFGNIMNIVKWSMIK